MNQVGGQDELVFDGGSFVMNADGTLAHVLPFWQEALAVTAVAVAGRRLCAATGRHDLDRRGARLSAIYNAMVLGLRDYVRKNGFPGVVLGLSGGIDSALTAVVAVDALGPGPRARRAAAVAVHQRAEHGRRRGDRRGCWACGSTRCRLEEPSTRCGAALAPVFAGRPRDVTEENLQARARGVLLMASPTSSASCL